MKRLALASISAAGILITACACSGPQVRSEGMKGLSLAHYSSYEWAPEQQNEQPHEFSKKRDDLLDHQIKSQVNDYLAKNGLRESTNHPDLKVSYAVRSKKEVEVSPGLYPEPFYNYWNDQPTERLVERNKGSIAIDLTDLKTGKLVWRGIAVSDIGDTGQSSSQVRESVASILQKLPGWSQTG